MALPGLVREFVELCLPAQCAACEGPARPDCFLCSDCDAALTRLEVAPACGRCAMPLAEAGAPCPYCGGKGLGRFDCVIALGKFDEPLKTLIHRMKYQRRWPIAEHLARRLLQKPRVKELLAVSTRMVPVPLHRSRRIARGYNQAEVAARCMARRLVASPMRRTRATAAQVDLHSHHLRVENLRGAFRLAQPRLVENEHVVVIDDVMTSGATLNSLAQAIAVGKPASLCAVVFAIADPRGRKFEAI